MASLAEDLPDLALIGIMRFALGPLLLPSADWAASLGALAVCRRWRAVGAPIMYADAWFTSPEQPPSHCGPKAKGPAARAEPATNLSLTLALEKSALVRSIRVDLCLASLANGLDALAKIANCWHADFSGVTALRISISPGYNEPLMGHDAVLGGQPERVATMASALVRGWPNVHDLELYSSTHTPDTSALFNVLADVYFDQLRVLNCTEPLEHRIMRFGPRLRHLEAIANVGAQCPMPRIPAQSIGRLQLENLPEGFSWAGYFSNPGSERVAFPRLRQLDLHFFASSLHSCLWPPQFDQSAKLTFPRLESLSIKDCPAGCNLFDGALVSPRLGDVSVSGAFSVLKGLCRLGIVSVHRLLIKIGSIETFSAADFVRVTNEIFGNWQVARSSGLTLCDVAFSLDSCDIRWRNLTDLNLLGGVSFGTLTRLIPRMPSLIVLNIRAARLDGGVREIVDSDSVDLEHACLELLSSRLKTMLLCFANSGYPEELMYKAIRFLILRTPSIRCLCIDHKIKHRVKDFSNGAPSPYRYLKKLTLY